MARTAQIDGNSVVINIIDAPQGFTLDGFLLVASATAQRGDLYDELGGTFSHPVTPAPVPPVVTMAQARIALSRAGKLAAVQSVVDGQGGETLLWWDYASEVHRSNPLVASLGAAVSLTSDDIDALFRTAATVA